MSEAARLLRIRASAGSGKTYALTGTFLRLLLGSRPTPQPAACCLGEDGYAWPEILAITFTNKAATEMKERVVGALKLTALGQADEAQAGGWTRERAGAFLDRILRHYAQLNIRTIDSLISQLLRIFALELGLAPDFETVFDTRAVFDPLYENLLARAESGDSDAAGLIEDACESLLRTERAPGFLLKPRLVERLQKVFAHMLGADPEGGAYFTDAPALADAIGESHAELLATLRDLDELLCAEAMPRARHFENFLAHIAASSPAESLKDSEYSRKESLADCVLKAGKSRVAERHEAAYAAFKDALAAYRLRCALIGGAMLYAPFVRLAEELHATLPEVRATHGIVPAAGWARLASGMLASGHGAPEAFCRMGARLRHMLMDEFQDTSREQWQALVPLAEECLAAGGGVLYVGDVKQAIYSWRGGDKDLFDEALGEPLSLLAAPALDELPMNWRSHRRIVEWNNRVFSLLSDPISAHEAAQALLRKAPDDVALSLAEALAQVYSGCAQQIPPKHKGTEGYVRVQTAVPEDGENTEGACLRLAVGLVADELSTRRPYAEIAVLVRDNEQASEVAAELIARGVPVITENSLTLAAHPLVRELAAFLAFLDYPSDNLSFFELIRGQALLPPDPMRTPRTIADWVAAQRSGALYRAFREDFPDAWGHIEPFHRKAGLMTPYDLAAQALAAFGVEARTPGDMAFARRFLEIVHGAEEKGRRSLASLLEFWREDGAGEKMPMPESVDAVRVMTIHKAKGLEFPVTIVPFHEWRTGASGIREFPAGGVRLLAPLKKDLGAPYYEELNKTLLEAVNLLYVAWTRASEELYVFLPPTDSPSPVPAMLSGILKRLGREEGHAVFEYGARPAPGSRAVEPRAGSALACAVASPSPFPALDAAEAPVRWLPRLKVYRNFSMDEDPSFGESERGTAFHAALERLVVPDAGADAEAACRLAARLAVRGLPLDADAAEALASDIAGALSWLLGQPGAASWLSGGVREASIADAEGVVHRVDLLAPDEDEVLVIDYKTGRASPEAAHEYAAQVRRYARLARDIYGKPARGLLIWLDERRIEEVDCRDPR